MYNDRATNLFDLMVRSVIKYTEPQPKFIICDNGGNDLEKYKSLKNFTIVSGSITKSKGSLQHGESLNKIVSLVETQNTAIIESDCVLLYKGWDQLLSNYKLVAAKKGIYKEFLYYHIFFTIFNTEALKGIDFRPGDGNRTNRNYKLHEDVGAKMGELVPPSQIKLLDFIDCKSNKGNFFNNSFQSDELHLDGTPICCHFGRGSNLSGKAIRHGFEHPQKQLIKWKEKVESLLGKEEEK